MHFLFAVLMILFPPDERPVPTEKLRAGLMAALGESFEFVGAEVGRTNVPIVGSREGGRRMWFARVRPTKAGEFAITYTAKFANPDTKMPNNSAARATYTLPIKIGERGAMRVISNPKFGAFGGRAYPHANVGDILVIGVHFDGNLTEHKFAASRTDIGRVASFFSVAGESVDQKYIERAANPSLVTNRAPDQLRLLSSWEDSVVNRPLTHSYNTIRAYLEFMRPSEFNIAGKFADAGDKSVGDGIAIRVKNQSEPVTVVLEHEDVVEHGDSELTSTKINYIYGGTIEARVGDRIRIACGEYVTPTENEPEKLRPCEVVLQPFKPAAAYEPEKK